MELVTTQLYGDRTQVVFEAALNSHQQKQCIKQVKAYLNALALEQVELSLERVAGYGLLNLWPINALVLYAPIGDCAMQAVITLNVFSRHAVVSLYKSFIADLEFAANYSTEVRRRAIITTLGAAELADRFALLDQSVERTWEFARQCVQELRLTQPEQSLA